MYLKLNTGDYIDAAAYGITTWGSQHHQKSIESSENKWYIVNAVCEDTYTDTWKKYYTKLDVSKAVLAMPADGALINKDEHEILLQWLK